MIEVTWSAAFEKLRRIRELEEDWDSYGAHPIKKEICDRVETILKMLQSVGWEVPQIVPSPEGTIQLEWHSNGRDEEWEIYFEYC